MGNARDSKEYLYRGTVIGLSLLLMIGILISACFQFSKSPPHIILISIDTLRHDHLGYKGYAPEKVSPSPFLDSLAEEGAIFTHAVSTSSWTLPGHYALLTGLPNELHEMVDDAVPYNPKIQTMAEFLKKEGYDTGGFYSGPYLHPFFGFERGFDMYEPCMKGETMYDVMEYKGEDLTQQEQEYMVAQKERSSHRDITSRRVVDTASFFGRMKKSDRMFFFLHFFDVHNDYIPPAPFNRRYDTNYRGWVNGHNVVIDERINPEMEPADLNHLKALYDGEIAWVDHNIEIFFKNLKKDFPEVFDNCIVVITSDHGEEFFEHGHIGHRWNIYGETLRIPLLIWAPGRVQGGIRVDDPVRIYDIYPTLLDLAGLPLPEQVYGRSIAGLLRGEKLKAEPIVSELTFIPSGQGEEGEYHKYYALQQDQYKMIGFEKRRWQKKNRIDFTGDIIEDSLEVYDLEKDPEEKNNLRDNQPDIVRQLTLLYLREVERMKGMYEKLHGKPGSSQKQSAAQIPEDLQKTLEETGYGAGARNQSRK